MIDLEREQLLTLAAAAALPELMKNGRKCHVSSLHRWCIHGVGGIKLESVVGGGGRRTTREAVRRFIHKLSNPASTAAPDTPEERKRRYDAADDRLSGDGI